jgi:hypothetical protein
MSNTNITGEELAEEVRNIVGGVETVDRVEVDDGALWKGCMNVVLYFDSEWRNMFARSDVIEPLLKNNIVVTAVDFNEEYVTLRKAYAETVTEAVEVEKEQLSVVN